ncbi:MAG: sulfotransferase [Armatimonadetes bacterium]|nr:sulfotransferase [Armatimonadota bacterium]MDW8121088.1 sulfotransferase [Armatimonadota bacterium]
MEEKGEHLIFLVSQPRSGSTLLQRILATHPRIATTGETWLLLPPLFALRQEGWQAEFQARSATFALQQFLSQLPGGSDDYFEGVRRMYGYLYGRARGERQYFLDKTPRYYLILAEIKRAFPQARFLFLFRNPLAVLHSIYRTSLIQNRLIAFYWVHSDLFRAVRLLLEGWQLLKDQALIVRYEELVREPEAVVSKVCEFLDLPFYPQMVEYGRFSLPRWRLGDQKVYELNRPDPKRAVQWIESLKDAQFWRLARDYLQLLGKDQVEQMGYSFNELREILETSRPRRSRLVLTFPISLLTEKRPEDRSRWQRAWIWGISLLQRQGLPGLLMALWDRLIGKTYGGPLLG